MIYDGDYIKTKYGDTKPLIFKGYLEGEYKQMFERMGISAKRYAKKQGMIGKFTIIVRPEIIIIKK